jgi:hypothetical protein
MRMVTKAELVGTADAEGNTDDMLPDDILLGVSVVIREGSRVGSFEGEGHEPCVTYGVGSHVGTSVDEGDDKSVGSIVGEGHEPCVTYGVGSHVGKSVDNDDGKSVGSIVGDGREPCVG